MIGFGLFHTAHLDYAISLSQIRRVLPGKEVFPLPGLPSGIEFVLVYDGTLVPVLSLDPAVTLQVGTGSSLCYALVDSEYGLLAFVTQPTSRIVAEHRGKLAVLTATESAWQTGIFNYHGRDYAVINVDVLATEIARGNGLNCLILSGMRRLNEEETAAGR